MPNHIERETAYQTLTAYYHHTTEIQHEALREALAKVPTADVRPVVHGSWKTHGDGACSCSVCQLGLESFVEGIFYNYCPFCGADMREEAE